MFILLNNFKNKMRIPIEEFFDLILVKFTS